MRLFRRWFRRRSQPPPPATLPIMVDSSIDPSMQATQWQATLTTIQATLNAMQVGSPQSIQDNFDVLQRQIAATEQPLSDISVGVTQLLNRRDLADTLTGIQGLLQHQYEESQHWQLNWLQDHPTRVPPPIIEEHGNIVYRFDPGQQCELRVISPFNPSYIIRLFLPRGDGNQGLYTRVSMLPETNLNGETVQRVGVRIHRDTLPKALFELIIAIWRDYWPLFWIVAITYEKSDLEHRRPLSSIYPAGGRDSFKRPGDLDNFGNLMPSNLQQDYIFYFDAQREVSMAAQQRQVPA